MISGSIESPAAADQNGKERLVRQTQALSRLTDGKIDRSPEIIGERLEIVFADDLPAGPAHGRQIMFPAGDRGEQGGEVSRDPAD